MYEIVKNVIESKRYELNDMIKKIDTLWIQGDLTEEQKNELTELARKNADPEMSVNVFKRLDDIEKRVRALEENKPVAPPSGDPEYPDYVPDKVYRKGDKVTFKGKKYLCVLNEYTDSTIWSPEAYPAYWQEIIN